MASQFLRFRYGLQVGRMQVVVARMQVLVGRMSVRVNGIGVGTTGGDVPTTGILTQESASMTRSAISTPTRACPSTVEAPICGVTDTRGWLMSSPAGFGDGFVDEHVHARGSHLAAVQRVDRDRFRPPRRRGRSSRAGRRLSFSRIPPRRMVGPVLLDEGDMQTDHVGLGEQLVLVLRVGHPCPLSLTKGSCCDDGHADADGALGRFHADVAEADDAEGLAREFDALAVFLLRPGARDASARC
jgi:hypothetical protein